jgi:chemosensory pili system protein ChpA (sensor histidine kinase/response regulator)
MKQFRTQPVVVVRSAGRRVAVHVDETVGQQEVIVKSVGGQLSSLPGLTGISVLPAGSIVLIYNPVALALVYGEQVAQFTARHANSDALSRTGSTMATHRPGDAVTGRKLVLVVDDSITVRKVTQRLLERAGYRVALASDGVQALSLLRGELADDLPFIILADIEMPHMDGFDLVRTLGGDARLAALPVVMITSRLAEKHRELATRLGVKHYLGKPFSEDHLLSLVAQYSALADLA